MAERGKKAKETRERLLSAALEVMAYKGYAEATIGEIARTAGVSKGLAYYHFKSKADMATEILRREVIELIEQFEDIASKSATSDQALKSMLAVLADLVCDNVVFSKFYLSALWRDGRVWSDEMRVIETRLINVIKEQFERGRSEGTVREDADTEFAAVSCIGLVLTTSMRYFGMEDGEQRLDKERFSAMIADTVSHAVGA